MRLFIVNLLKYIFLNAKKIKKVNLKIKNQL